MSRLAPFLGLMSTSVIVKAFSTEDASGAVTYSTAASTYSARVVSKPVQTFDSRGAEVVARHVAYVASTSRIGAKDQLTWNGSTYRIVSVETPTDQFGVHHNKVLLG